MPFARINGLQLFYHEQGPADPDAPVILFVHGTQGNASLYADLIDTLSDRFRCAVLNHRGRPPSDSPDDPSLYSIEQFADDQAEFIQQRGYRDITIMGWSLGVRTTLAYLHRHGVERVGRAILVAGPPSPNFGGQPLTPPDQDAPPREVWGQQFRASTEACWEGSQQSRSTCDLEATLGSIEIPVAIFPGRHDPICPHAAAEFMAAQIPNATLKTFEESGHAPLTTEPEPFVEETVAFIERCADPA
jgi:pimeloyl-ACP methyl ester carboxylesterase